MAIRWSLLWVCSLAGVFSGAIQGSTFDAKQPQPNVLYKGLIASLARRCEAERKEPFSNALMCATSACFTSLMRVGLVIGAENALRCSPRLFGVAGGSLAWSTIPFAGFYASRVMLESVRSRLACCPQRRQQNNYSLMGNFLFSLYLKYVLHAPEICLPPCVRHARHIYKKCAYEANHYLSKVGELDKAGMDEILRLCDAGCNGKDLRQRFLALNARMLLQQRPLIPADVCKALQSAGEYRTFYDECCKLYEAKNVRDDRNSPGCSLMDFFTAVKNEECDRKASDHQHVGAPTNRPGQLELSKKTALEFLRVTSTEDRATLRRLAELRYRAEYPSCSPAATQAYRATIALIEESPGSGPDQATETRSSMFAYGLRHVPGACLVTGLSRYGGGLLRSCGNFVSRLTGFVCRVARELV